MKETLEEIWGWIIVLWVLVGFPIVAALILHWMGWGLK